MKALRSFAWETVAIFFAILAMWPMILRWEGLIFKIILYFALLLMVLVLVRRWKRFSRLGEAENDRGRQDDRDRKQSPRREG